MIVQRTSLITPTSCCCGCNCRCTHKQMFKRSSLNTIWCNISVMVLHRLHVGQAKELSGYQAAQNKSIFMWCWMKWLSSDSSNHATFQCQHWFTLSCSNKVDTTVSSSYGAAAASVAVASEECTQNTDPMPYLTWYENQVFFSSCSTSPAFYVSIQTQRW